MSTSIVNVWSSESQTSEPELNVITKWNEGTRKGYTVEEDSLRFRNRSGTAEIDIRRMQDQNKLSRKWR